MKHAILIIGLIGLLISCHYEKLDYYTGESYVAIWREVPGADSGYIAFKPTNVPWNGDFAVSASKQYDTAWFKIQAFGYPSTEGRKLRFEQYIVEDDGCVSPVSGVNFVPLDDRELLEYYMFPADTAVTSVPVVIRHDPNSTTRTRYCLYVRLVPTEDFQVVSFGSSRGMITFTDN